MTEDNAMFHITLITVGKLKERYYAAAADEYIRRLGAYCKFELIELPECRLPDDPNGKTFVGNTFSSLSSHTLNASSTLIETSLYVNAAFSLTSPSFV